MQPTASPVAAPHRPAAEPDRHPAGTPAPAGCRPSGFPAHLDLVEALLQAGEVDPQRPSYALLWEDSAAEQRRAGRDAADAEAAVELLVTEVMALSRSVPWFRHGSPLREAAIAETIAFWAAGAGVASARAHEAWRRCTRSRATVTRHVALAHSDLAAAVAAEQRLQEEWAAAWAEWSERLVPATF